MADEAQELELDVNEKKGGKKTVILIAVAVLLVNAIGVGAWIFLGQSDEGKQSSNKIAKQEYAGKPIKYLTMVPEFIVNFGPDSKVRYLQVDLQISTRQEDSLKIISDYRPVLRNDILVVLSGVRYEDLKDRAGKEALQKKLLDTINKVVVAAQSQTSANDEETAQNENEPVEGPIENVFYTSFIMQ